MWSRLRIRTKLGSRLVQQVHGDSVLVAVVASFLLGVLKPVSPVSIRSARLHHANATNVRSSSSLSPNMAGLASLSSVGNVEDVGVASAALADMVSVRALESRVEARNWEGEWRAGARVSRQDATGSRVNNKAGQPGCNRCPPGWSATAPIAAETPPARLGAGTCHSARRRADGWMAHWTTPTPSSPLGQQQNHL